MKSSTGIKIVNGFAAALFFVFAALQINDYLDSEIYHNPSKLDAALWFLFYLFIGVLALVVIFRKIPLWILILAALACLIEMAMTGPGLYQNLTGDKPFTMTQASMTADDPRVELSREFFGALIALAGVAWIGWQHRCCVKTTLADSST